MKRLSLLWASLALLLVWQLAAMLLNKDILPAPLTVFAAFFGDIGGELGGHFLASLWRVLASLVLSIALAAPAGLVMGQSKRLNQIFSPVIYLLFPIPKVVLVPIVMLFLGINDLSKIVDFNRLFR